MGRNENIAIFAQSRGLWTTDAALRDAVTETKSRTVLVPERKTIPCHEGDRRSRERVFVKVSRKRSLEAAAAWKSKRTCVLNFASATNPGGGVERGANAQEENLCRCTTLYPCLDTEAMRSGFYEPHRAAGDPLHNDDCIYTPRVRVFRSDDESAEILPEDARFSVDVLTCAAPNLRARPSNAMNPGDGQAGVEISNAALSRLLKKRIRRIFDLAAEHGAEVLILGAFGCGAFANPPKVVAAAFRDVLEDYDRCFERVEFAVHCSPEHEENYRAFFNAFAGWN